MAQRIEKFTLVAAAGASDLFQSHSFLDGTVQAVELYVPPGHAGLTEWSLWFGDAQLVPKTAGSAIVADDQQFVWDLQDAPTGDQYRSKYSNSDDFPHSFHLQVWLDEFGTEDGDLFGAFELPLLTPLGLAEESDGGGASATPALAE